MAKQIRILPVATAATAVVCAAVSSCQLPSTLGLNRSAPSAGSVTQSQTTPVTTEGAPASSLSFPSQPLFGTGTITLPAGSEPLANHSTPPSLDDLDRYNALSQKVEQLTAQIAAMTAANNGNVAGGASNIAIVATDEPIKMGKNTAVDVTVRETTAQVVARPVVRRTFPEVAGVEDVSDDREIRIRIDEGEVYTSGTYDLLPTAKDTLLKVTRVLKEEFPSAKLRVESHTDDFSGTKLTAKEILDISTEKAKQVADVLVELQLYRIADLQVRGVGAGVPIADNKMAEGRRKNNRIELVVLSIVP